MALGNALPGNRCFPRAPKGKWQREVTQSPTRIATTNGLTIVGRRDEWFVKLAYDQPSGLFVGEALTHSRRNLAERRRPTQRRLRSILVTRATPARFRMLRTNTSFASANTKPAIDLRAA